MKALVLAGGFPQIALIQELKSRGITTVLADYNSNPVAKEYCDIFYQKSTQDAEAIENIAKNENIDFLITVCSEQAIQMVALVSEKLGLPCYIDYTTIKNATNKEYMKKVFKQIGIPNARSIILHGDEQIGDQYFNFPIIVKPADCSGSSGVRKVWNDEELHLAISDAKKMSKTSTVIVEEFLSGLEISVDALVIEGKAHVVCITNSEKIADDGRFVIYRGNYPALENESLIRPEIERIIQNIAGVFGLKNSPMLAQMIYANGKLYVLEFSARTGGSAKYLLAKKSCGIDLIKAVVDITLGIKPIIGEIKSENNYISNEYLYCRPGVFDRLEGFDALKKEGIISEYYQFKWQNIVTKDICHSGDRIAGFTIQADTKSEMHRKHHMAMSRIRILDIDGKDMLRKDLLGDLYGEQ